ncbi:hypothetical protein KP79_PYT09356 [Mizuhopecten yessoensis]|uniref:Uncharacterized protein n=1 Tax=Mizuhopecten yessoensis TaxID=6573 RepID=A0A210QU89_MIZYE|nr:hypothetical protein KP79_PYT09356 [Mizuhopecten yessoensis]
MIHAGNGKRQVNSLLSELNIPHISKWTQLARQNVAAQTSHITQMAAVYGDKKWSIYVFPKQPISKGASDITGISISGSRMYHHGKVVTPSSISCAIEGFLSFIQKVPKPVFLAGHNI